MDAGKPLDGRYAGNSTRRRHRSVALANKTACIAWALMTKGGISRAPTVHA